MVPSVSPDWPYISEYLLRHRVSAEVFDMCEYAYAHLWDAESNGASVPWRNSRLEFFFPSELDLEENTSCYLKKSDGSPAKLPHPVFVVHDGIWKRRGVFRDQLGMVKVWTRWQNDQFLRRGMTECHFPAKAVWRWIGCNVGRLWIRW